MAEEKIDAEATPLEAAEAEMATPFAKSMMRNHKKLREDRASTMARSTKLRYGRYVEDLEEKLVQLETDRQALLDLGHVSKDTIISVSDWDPEGFVAKDVKIGVEIRETKIRLEIARTQYDTLFGG